MNKIIVFLKSPIEGRVKTRLAANVGDKKATQIYRWLSAYTQSVVQDSKIAAIYYYDEIPAENSKTEAQFKVQSGSNLAERMIGALQSECSNSSVVLIGSDCPEITSETLNRSFEKLKSADIVIGPARDGGFYLLGMKKDFSSILKHVNWQSKTVATQVIQNATQLNLKVAMLDELYDVDTAEDFYRFQLKFEEYLKSKFEVIEN